MTVVATTPVRRFGAARDVVNGIVAVGVKELRGRMRGRRAFVILTVHLLLVAGFAWMIEAFAERSLSGSFGTFSASADVGRQLFTALLLLQTLVVLVLAPASTAGAISLEREKQTLDLLTTTPISSLAIVLGKLFSALGWVFLLLLASIPVTALVFTFGGVAPDDLIRGYAVLLVSAIGYGSIGLFVSALVKRTQAATVINLVAALTLTAGATFLFAFWLAMAPGSTTAGVVARDQGPLGFLRRPPEALMYLNPFVAQVDVVCGTETGFGSSCGLVGWVTNRPTIGVDAPVEKDPGFVDNGLTLGVARDTFWPKSIAAFSIVSLVLIVLSVQLVSPTRRWRLRLRPSRRRPAGSDL